MLVSPSRVLTMAAGASMSRGSTSAFVTCGSVLRHCRCSPEAGTVVAQVRRSCMASVTTRGRFTTGIHWLTTQRGRLGAWRRGDLLHTIPEPDSLPQRYGHRLRELGRRSWGAVGARATAVLPCHATTQPAPEQAETTIQRCRRRIGRIAGHSWARAGLAASLLLSLVWAARRQRCRDEPVA